VNEFNTKLEMVEFYTYGVVTVINGGSHDIEAAETAASA